MCCALVRVIIISNLSACCNQQVDQHRTVWMGCKGICSIEVRERWMKWRRVVLRVTYARANLVYSCLYQSQRIPSIAKTNISVFSKPGCGIGYEYWNQYTINHAGKAHQRIMAAIIWCLYIIQMIWRAWQKEGKRRREWRRQLQRGCSYEMILSSLGTCECSTSYVPRHATYHSQKLY